MTRYSTSCLGNWARKPSATRVAGNAELGAVLIAWMPLTTAWTALTARFTSSGENDPAADAPSPTTPPTFRPPSPSSRRRLS